MTPPPADAARNSVNPHAAFALHHASPMRLAAVIAIALALPAVARAQAISSGSCTGAKAGSARLPIPHADRSFTTLPHSNHAPRAFGHDERDRASAANNPNINL